jgi:hypothetical protein
MSYDIYLYKSKTGIPDEDEADAIIATDMDKWAVKEINSHIKLSIVKALTKYNPRLEANDFQYGDVANLTVKTIEEEKNKFDHIEINTSDGDFMVTIIVYNNHVFITTPYFHTGVKAQELFKDINSYIRIIRETAGYFVFDPQTGQTFDPAENNFEGLNKYLSVSEHLDEIIDPGNNKSSSVAKEKSKKPW